MAGSWCVRCEKASIAKMASNLAGLAVKLDRAHNRYMTPTVSGPDLDAAWEHLQETQREYQAAVAAYAPFVKEEP